MLQIIFFRYFFGLYSLAAPLRTEDNDVH
jgi:hypothetical protein